MLMTITKQKDLKDLRGKYMDKSYSTGMWIEEREEDSMCIIRCIV